MLQTADITCLILQMRKRVEYKPLIQGDLAGWSRHEGVGRNPDPIRHTHCLHRGWQLERTVSEQSLISPGFLSGPPAFPHEPTRISLSPFCSRKPG